MRHGLSIILFFSIVNSNVNARCFRQNQCTCIKDIVSCRSIHQLPSFPLAYAKTVRVLSLRECRFSSIYQLQTLAAWINLVTVDLRDQLVEFDCDFEANYTFNIITDCQMHTTENSRYHRFNETRKPISISTSTSTTTPRPRIKKTTHITPSTLAITSTTSSTTSKTTSTTMKRPRLNSKRPVPPKHYTSPRNITRTSTTTVSNLPSTTNTTTSASTTVLTSNTTTKEHHGRMLIIVISISITAAIICAISVTALVLILCKIYGGFCNCLTRVSLWPFNGDRKDRDSDQGDNISLTNTTLFDITDIQGQYETELTTKRPCAETLRPRCHKKTI